VFLQEEGQEQKNAAIGNYPPDIDCAHQTLVVLWKIGIAFRHQHYFLQLNCRLHRI